MRAKEKFFSVGDQPLEILGEFEYLVRVLDKSSNDWSALYANLAKARKCWGRFGRILGREGADVHTSGLFYHAVVQTLLLYGSIKLVLTVPMLAALEGFHMGYAREIMLIHPRRLERGRWSNMDSACVLPAVGLQTVDTLHKEAANHSDRVSGHKAILDRYWQREEPVGGGWPRVRWWDLAVPPFWKDSDWQGGSRGGWDRSCCGESNSEE